MRRALARDPADRYVSAVAMAGDVQRLLVYSSASVSQAQSKPWLLVLSFRVLRPDPEAELLAFGLADAARRPSAASPGSAMWMPGTSEPARP